jgi:HPt (histidine-containing phosphotransfer) domain-containing protein
MTDLQSLYRQAMPGRIAELSDALAAVRAGEDAAMERVRRLAHALRGSGGTYGFPAVSAAAQAVEDATPTDIEPRTGELLAVLRAVAAPPTPDADA